MIEINKEQLTRVCYRVLKIAFIIFILGIVYMIMRVL